MWDTGMEFQCKQEMKGWRSKCRFTNTPSSFMCLRSENHSPIGTNFTHRNCKQKKIPPGSWRSDPAEEASPAPVEWDSRHKPAWFPYEGLSEYRWARPADHTFLSANTAWGAYISCSSHPCIPTVQPLLTVLFCHVFKRKSGAWWTPLEADAALMGRDAWWGWDVLQAAHQ